MAALTQGKQNSQVIGKRKSAPMKAGEIIMQGGIVMLDSSGRALAGATATGCVGAGIARSNSGLDRWDNSAGADGDIDVIFDEGAFEFENTGGDAIAAGDEGKPAYITDDQTVSASSASGTKSPAGRVVMFDSKPYVYVAAHVARQIAEEGVQAPGTAWTQTYATASTTVATQTAVNPDAATAAALTDNSGGSADTTIAAVTAAAAIADNSGGTDPGDNTIASITNAANAGSADVAPVQNAIAQLAAKLNTTSTAVGAAMNNFADLAAQVNALITDVASIRTQLTATIADVLANKKNINGIVDDLQSAGIES